jgi:hypothetical protein
VPVRRVQVLSHSSASRRRRSSPFLPIVLHERGLSAAEIGVVLSLAALAGFVAALLWATRPTGGWAPSERSSWKASSG